VRSQVAGQRLAAAQLWRCLDQNVQSGGDAAATAHAAGKVYARLVPLVRKAFGQAEVA
jgi:hypothetical protein